jgi:hypothetical protein
MEKLKEGVVWEAKVRQIDIGGMDEVMINKMIVELNLNFQKICWDYGIHN